VKALSQPTATAVFNAVTTIGLSETVTDLGRAGMFRLMGILVSTLLIAALAAFLLLLPRQLPTE
jgi:hypothetical protein